MATAPAATDRRRAIAPSRQALRRDLEDDLRIATSLTALARVSRAANARCAAQFGDAGSSSAVSLASAACRHSGHRP